MPCGRRAAALGLVLVLSACGSEPGGSPEFGGGEAPGADVAELVQQAGDVGLAECPEPSEERAPVDDTEADGALPSLELTCLTDGEPFDLASLEGPAVVNLWASWCEPCREELPLLARLDEEAGDAVQVLGIDVADRAPEKALQLAEDSGVAYPQLFDPDQLTRAPLGVQGLPQTVFVDAQGTMVATERTPYRSYDDLLDDVDRHLGVRP